MCKHAFSFEKQKINSLTFANQFHFPSNCKPFNFVWHWWYLPQILHTIPLHLQITIVTAKVIIWNDMIYVNFNLICWKKSDISWIFERIFEKAFLLLVRFPLHNILIAKLLENRKTFGKTSCFLCLWNFQTTWYRSL